MYTLFKYLEEKEEEGTEMEKKDIALIYCQTIYSVCVCVCMST